MNNENFVISAKSQKHNIMVLNGNWRGDYVPRRHMAMFEHSFSCQLWAGVGAPGI